MKCNSICYGKFPLTDTFYGEFTYLTENPEEDLCLDLYGMYMLVCSHNGSMYTFWFSRRKYST